MDYKYYKFVKGRYFRVLPKEERFQVINNDNLWEDNDMIYFLYIDPGIDYAEVKDETTLNELKNLGEAKKEVIRK